MLHQIVCDMAIENMKENILIILIKLQKFTSLILFLFGKIFCEDKIISLPQACSKHAGKVAAHLQ